MTKTPKCVLKYMEEIGEEQEADVRIFISRQRQVFQKLQAPGTDFIGWIALKMACTRGDARAAIRWAEGRSRKERPKPADPLKPEPTILVKLRSLAVHADKYLSPGRHEYDQIAIRSLLDDPEIKEWMKEMERIAFLPTKRKP